MAPTEREDVGKSDKQIAEEEREVRKKEMKSRDEARMQALVMRGEMKENVMEEEKCKERVLIYWGQVMPGRS